MTPPLEEASEFAGASFNSFVKALEEPQRELTELQGQLLSYAFNVAMARVFSEHGLTPALMAGHSMGIYSALTSTGAISFGDGLEVVAAAYRKVAEVVEKRGVDCSMAVVVGLEQAEIEELLSERPEGDSVLLVNSNNDTTKIFAGLRSDLGDFIERAKSRDALKARLLPVTSPYHHTHLLDGASARFEIELRKYRWNDGDVPIVSSIDQTLLSSAEELLDLTARNISTPIDWERVAGQLVAEGTELMIECGAGLSLTQNGRLMPDCPPFVNVKNSKKRLGR